MTNREYMKSVGIAKMFDVNINFDDELTDDTKEFFDLVSDVFDKEETNEQINSTTAQERS